MLERPGSSRAAELLGLRNRYTGQMQAPDTLAWGPWELKVAAGADYRAWGVAAERIVLCEPGEAGPNRLQAVVQAVRPTAHGLYIRAEVPGAGVVEVRHPFREAGAPLLHDGMAIGLHVPQAAIFPLDDRT
ncbi:hypothetical protein D3C72_1905790 [compost metagenome]